jgi:hypothetical protein
MTGTIHLRDNGVDFRVADTVSIRIAWRGSKEVGNPYSNPADLPRLFANGKRARAEILAARPTEHKVGGGDDERRIWRLRLRVHPDDEPAFEASADHGFRLSPDLEEKIEKGYSVDMLSAADGPELEALYDPDDHEQVIVRLDDSGAGRVRLQGIVGKPAGDVDKPPRSAS